MATLSNRKEYHLVKREKLQEGLEKPLKVENLREETEIEIDDKEIYKAKKLLEANGYVVEKKPLSTIEKFMESQKNDDDYADDNDDFEDDDKIHLMM